MIRARRRRCSKMGLVIFEDALSAQIALARRVWADKGEQRVFRCGGHWHLSQALSEEALN